MIHDSMERILRYDIPLKHALISFLKEHKAEDLPVGEIEIKGRDLFVRPAEYRTRSPEEGRFETHQAYMDLQYVVKGAEIMQSAPSDRLSQLTAYDAATDCQFFTADADITSVLVRSGEFIVYYPGEAHRPMCQRGLGAELVKKLVFKIRMS